MDVPPSAHPADETLRAYVLGKLAGALSTQVESHLDDCATCRGWLAETSDDTFLGPLREGAGVLPNGKEAAMAEKLEARTEAASHPLPPELANQYELVRELGRGGMGVVWLARNKLLNRLEALKILNKEMLERRGTLDRFLREIRVVAQLSHENVVHAYSALQVGQSLVFVLEYVDGIDLARLVKQRGPLPVAHACYFAHQAALGLQHAHERGMVHRDIKPSNLILQKQGQRAIVKVLDFGLAKALSEQVADGSLTHEGQMLGTPDYIAPEQTLDAQKTDIRADIYSLGCTLYFLLSGNPPFRGTSLYDLLQAHHSTDPRPLSLVRPEAPAELAAVVARMMAKDPERRYQTPREVSHALSPFFKPAPTLARAEPPEAVYRPVESPAESGGQTPGPKWASLIEFKETERSAEPLAAPEPTPSASPPRWSRRVRAAVAIGLLVTGVLGAWTAVQQIGRVKRVVRRDQRVVIEHGKRPPAVAKQEPALSSRAQERKGGRQVVSLFNGRDLSGWKSLLDNGSRWEVVDGDLEGRGGGPSKPAVLVLDDRALMNFKLRLKARYVRPGGGWVELRRTASGESGRNTSCYAVAQGAWPSDVAPAGSAGVARNYVYGTPAKGEVQGTTAPLATNCWHHYEFVVENFRITTIIDGSVASELTDDDELYPSGTIALAVNGLDEARFREIELQEIADDELTTPRSSTRGRFAALFNGKDLSGWMDLLPNHSAWTVVDGAIEGRGGGWGEPGVLLLTNQQFSNFRLRFQVRYLGNGFGWVELRRQGAEIADGCYAVGYAVLPEFVPVGSVIRLQRSHYGERAEWDYEPQRVPFTPDAWHRLEITVVKNRITTALDGEPVGDYLDPDAIHTSGTIALACGAVDTTVQYKDVLIERLPDDAVPQPVPSTAGTP